MMKFGGNTRIWEWALQRVVSSMYKKMIQIICKYKVRRNKVKRRNYIYYYCLAGYV